jgi:hypothetical protein
VSVIGGGVGVNIKRNEGKWGKVGHWDRYDANPGHRHIPICLL